MKSQKKEELKLLEDALVWAEKELKHWIKFIEDLKKRIKKLKDNTK